MFKDIIYIEEAILNHPNTLKILKSFKTANIITIAHYKDVFNQPGSDWRLQKASQKIILAQRKDNFYYKGSEITPDFGYDNFYYNTLSLNCIYDCDYCYLQGLFTSAHLVIFVNNNDFIFETKKLIDKSVKPVYLALSYDTDLLAIEKWFPFCKEWIEFAALEQNLIIEIRTKSANVNALKNCLPNANVILAWTLSPEGIAKKFEPLTPPLTSRINAINQVVENGWEVRICIDPIIYVPDWESEYRQLIETIFNSVPVKKINSFSLGVFRMNKIFLKNIRRQRSNTSVIYYPFTLKNDLYSYDETTKYKMLTFIKKEITTRNPDIKIEVI